MSTKCAPVVADMFFWYEKHFMTSISDDNQADVIEVFNFLSRYLDAVLNITNPYFEGIIVKKCIHLNKANT